MLTTADKATSDPAGFAAQQRFAALSWDSSLRTADTTHTGMVDDPAGSAPTVRAVLDTVSAVRSVTRPVGAAPDHR